MRSMLYWWRINRLWVPSGSYVYDGLWCALEGICVEWCSMCASGGSPGFWRPPADIHKCNRLILNESWGPLLSLSSINWKKSVSMNILRMCFCMHELNGLLHICITSVGDTQLNKLPHWPWWFQYDRCIVTYRNIH